MKKRFLFLTCLMSLCSGCGDEPVVNNEPYIAKGYVRYDLKDALSRKTEGVGAQFDTCIIDANNKSTDWNVIKNAVEISNLQAVRIRFYPEMYERGNDNDDPNVFDYNSPNVDFNSAEMQHLYQLLDLFEENHVNVDLSWYGCRTTFVSEDGKYKGSFMGGNYGDPGITNWMAAPSDKYVAKPDEEFAESVASCLNYLINTKKYTCLYEYSLFPEPDGVISDMNLYGKISNGVINRLKEYGIKDKILFSGPADYWNDPGILEETYIKKDYGYEKLDSSVYKFRGEVDVYGKKSFASDNEEMLEFAKEFVNVADKYDMSWGLAECGTSNFLTAVTNTDTELYDRAITMGRYFINFTNAGATNLKYFIFADCNYDGVNNEEGMIRYFKEYYEDSVMDYQAKPIWYSWSLIMRYTDIGSSIYPITNSYSNGEDPDVCITALHLPDGSWTYVMANMATETKKVAINNPFDCNLGTMQYFKLTEASTPTREDATIKILDKTSDLETYKGVTHIKIPAKGFVVVSNKK